MRLVFLPILLLSSGCASTPKGNAEPPFSTCQEDKPRLEARSNELKMIVKADQDDRSDWQNKTMEEMLLVVRRDEQRRKRVGEIFGEGCFSTAADYGAAALVFQHGNVSDHFLQTFLWAKKSIELGDVTQKQLVADAIDRYLISLGKKQLFGTQATRPSADPKDCWCLEQTESSFPEKRRSEYSKKSLKELVAWVGTLNAENPACAITKFCDKDLKPSPKGAVPGFW